MCLNVTVHRIEIIKPIFPKSPASRYLRSKQFEYLYRHLLFIAREGGVEDFGDHIFSVSVEGGSVVSNKV